MPGQVETYFQHNDYLPVRPVLRARLQSILDSRSSPEMRRVAIEETAYVFPLFAFNLLKLVNSSKFNLKTKIVVLKQAMTFPTLEQFADLVCIMPEYPAELSDVLSLDRFEQHSRAAAVTVQILSSIGKRFSTLDRERLFSAALFHDIGRIFLAVSDPDGYQRLVSKTDESMPRLQAERMYFGTDHATVGALALESIGIADADVLSAVRLHHDVPPGFGVLVAYADRLVKRFGVGPSTGSDMAVGVETRDDAVLRVAVEETVHETIGEVLMHVLSEVDAHLAPPAPR